MAVAATADEDKTDIDHDDKKKTGLDIYGLLEQLRYALVTLWLFTASDVKTIVVPTTVFGVTNALAARRLGLQPSAVLGQPATAASTWHCAARVALWTWAVLLPFAINNQRHPQSILEDALNKPWRPLPARRLRPAHATRLMLAAYALSLAASLALGGLPYALAGIALGVWYNRLGGADASCLVRNLLNALGYLCFAAGGLEVALGPAAARPLAALRAPRSARWLAMVAAVVLSSVHCQDLPDQAGDAARRRDTVPLALGDALCRRLLAVTMLGWGVVCPGFWAAGVGARVAFLGVAWLVAARCLLFRTVAADKATFRIWCGWMMALYALPLFSSEHALVT